MAGSSSAYQNGRNIYDMDTRRFYEGNEVLIDMKLDLNTGELHYCLVGDDKVAKMTGIEKNNQKGFTPHINIYYSLCKVQVKKIPYSWFGKNPKRVKFKW